MVAILHNTLATSLSIIIMQSDLLLPLCQLVSDLRYDKTSLWCKHLMRPMPLLQYQILSDPCHLTICGQQREPRAENINRERIIDQ